MACFISTCRLIFVGERRIGSYFNILIGLTVDEPKTGDMGFVHHVEAPGIVHRAIGWKVAEACDHELEGEAREVTGKGPDLH